MKSLQDWLTYLETVQPQPQLTLSRIKIVAKNLGLLPTSYINIVVAGTNGKGSIVATCTAILKSAGYKVGTYTSPHLFAYNERISVNDTHVSDTEILQAFHTIKEAQADTELSYFEYGVLAALIIFKREDVDIAVMEIGLGGRFDAVNIIDATVAVISNISLDHTHMLGESIEAIAHEKSGIMRHGVATVYGDTNIPNSILKKASSLQVDLHSPEAQYSFVEYEDTWEWKFRDIHLQNLPHPKVMLQNAAAALMAIHLLPKTFCISSQHIKNGLGNINILARQQIVCKRPMIIVDVAHNPDSVKALCSMVQRLRCKGKVIVVFSALNTKDVSGMVANIKPIVNAWHIATVNTPLSISKPNLLKALSDVPYTFHENLKKALFTAKSNINAEDIIIVFGSFYVISELMPAIYADKQLVTVTSNANIK